MALYSYECPACKFRSARIHTLKNGEKELCPICLNVMKRDLPRLANPRFKGSGFYETDYKKGKLHPMDLKTAVGEALVKKLEPARKHFSKPKLKKIVEKMKSLTITR